MLLVKAILKQSAIHGLGCFAAEDIAKGQVVWRLDPRLDVITPCDKLGALPESIQWFLTIWGYSTEIDGQRVCILCGDHAKHMNHSDQPNCADQFIDGVSANVALRDIAAGEELTCNYYDFDLDVGDKLG
jgi:hypothetical protein